MEKNKRLEIAKKAERRNREGEKYTDIAADFDITAATLRNYRRELAAEKEKEEKEEAESQINVSRETKEKPDLLEEELQKVAEQTKKNKEEKEEKGKKEQEPDKTANKTKRINENIFLLAGGSFVAVLLILIFRRGQNKDEKRTGAGTETGTGENAKKGHNGGIERIPKSRKGGTGNRFQY